MKFHGCILVVVWWEIKGYIYKVGSWLKIFLIEVEIQLNLVNLVVAYVVCLCLLTHPFPQRMARNLKYASLFWLSIFYAWRIPIGSYESCHLCNIGGIDWSLTHMLQCTPFISKDRTPYLKGCYLVWGTFLIGNLIPETRNLTDCFFLTGVIEGFLFLLNFPHFKNKNKK